MKVLAFVTSELRNPVSCHRHVRPSENNIRNGPAERVSPATVLVQIVVIAITRGAMTAAAGKQVGLIADLKAKQMFFCRGSNSLRLLNRVFLCTIPEVQSPDKIPPG